MRKLFVAACLLGSLLLQGCNVGLGGLLYALLRDDGDGGGEKKSGQTEVSNGELIALENARLRPAQSVIVFSLRSSDKKTLDLQVELSDGGAGFQPATVSPPPSGKASSKTPGSLKHLPASPAGVVSRIPWDALIDLGDDALHHVQLRISGEIDQPIVADVLVGDDPPELRDVALTQRPAEDVSLGVLIADSSADPVDIDLEFATDEDGAGQPFFGPARSVSGNTGLPSEPEGLVSSFNWKAVSDAGRFDRTAAIRLTPYDRIAGEKGKTGKPLVKMLSLDNNRSPEAEILDGEMLTDPDQRRGIAMRFVVRDLEGNPVDAIIQWAAGGGNFPELDPALDTDASARAALLADPSAMKTLQITDARTEPIEGTVEQPAPGLTLGKNEILASWLNARSELRAVAGDCASGHCALEGKLVTLPGTGGDEGQKRHACSYAPATGILTVDSDFDPAPEPGALVEIDLGGPEGSLRLASSADGISQRLVWDGAVNSPGGGGVRFRITPYDRVAQSDAGCSAAPGADAPGIATGARGLTGTSGGAKRTRGPFSEADTQSLRLAPIDQPIALAAVDINEDGRMDVACATRFTSSVILFLQNRPEIYDTIRLTDAKLRGPSGLVARDLDADGDVDLAVSDDISGKVLLAYQEPGLDFFTQRASLTARGALKSPAGITAADFDGDGDVDLAVAEAGGESRGVRIFFRGNGPTGCEEAEGGYRSCFLLDPNNEAPHAIASAKVTDDSTFDIVTAGDGFFALYSLQFTASEVQFRYTRIDAPGTNLQSVAVGDLDGNGRLDLVAPDLAGRAVQIASQNSQIGFGLLTPIVSASLRGPVGIVQGDFDGNAITDFAVADPGDPATLLGGNVCVFLGSGAGKHSGDTLDRAAGSESPATSPRAVAAADFDGDGRQDLVSADGGAHEVVLFRQGGPGAFREGATVLAPGQRVPALSGLTASDLNGDGKVDVLASSRDSDSLTLYEQEAIGSFAALAVPLPAAETGEGASVQRGPLAATAGDLNGDGRADLVSANVDSNDLTVLLQDEHGDFTAFNVSGDGFRGPESVAFSDIDGDGKLDIVAAARFSDDARWFRQGADGGFTEGGVFRQGTDAGAPRIVGPIFVAAGDLDRDGKSDIITANHRSGNLTLFLQGDTRGQFLAPIDVQLGTGNRPVAIAVADLDGNGALDLATANLGKNAVSILLQSATGELEPSSLEAIVGYQATALAARDLDGDGNSDLAVAFSGQRGSFVKVYFQSGGALFSEAKSIRLSAPSLSAPVQIILADLDGDGEPDLATANRQSRNVTVFFGGR